MSRINQKGHCVKNVYLRYKYIYFDKHAPYKHHTSQKCHSKSALNVTVYKKALLHTTVDIV